MPRRIKLPPPVPGKDPLNELYSAWVVTINTNTARAVVIRPFREAWENIVQHMGTFMIGRPGGELLDVRERHAFERGPKFHKIHMHSRLETHTLGLAFIDKAKIQEYVNAYIKKYDPNFKGCYIHYDLVKNYNASRYIEAYLNKTQYLQDEVIA